MEFGLDNCAKIVLQKGKLVVIKFNTSLKQINTRARTGENIQIPRDR